MYKVRLLNYLDEKFGIQVNFSDNHSTYYTAYRYITKQDKDAVHSRGHPDLLDAVPRTERAITSRKKKAKQKGKGKRKSRAKASEHLSVYDVCEIVQAKGITSRLQLVCLAVQQNREGTMFSVKCRAIVIVTQHVINTVLDYCNFKSVACFV